MVSTGYSSATCAFISEPSPLTIISGASMRFGLQHRRERLDQVPDLRRQTRIERCGERAARCVQSGTELMGAGHGF